jgi:hypothetical protein
MDARIRSAGMLATAIAMTPATAGTKATAGTHNTRDTQQQQQQHSSDASNSRMLEKVVKPALTCREANYSRDTVKPEMTAAAGTIETSWMSTAAGPPESDSRKVSKSIEKPATFSRDASNSSRNSQLESIGIAHLCLR